MTLLLYPAALCSRRKAARRICRPTRPMRPGSSWDDPALRGTPLALVAAGVLAANPHDSQPWLFHVTPDRIEISADTSRQSGCDGSGFLREMHIGLGCALENIAVVAPANLDMPLRLLLSRDRSRVLPSTSAPVRAATVILTKIGGAAARFRTSRPRSRFDTPIVFPTILCARFRKPGATLHCRDPRGAGSARIPVRDAGGSQALTPVPPSSTRRRQLSPTRR